MFRLLKANEIECKVATIKDNGLQLLLYKTARTDMDLLDETILPMNWECEYKEIKGNMYCGITVTDEKGNKTTKWDCGTESAFGDKEKGEASDAFKRAGFKWGIGRELYTSPFIWITSQNCKIENKKCYDNFEVVKIGYNENKEINELQIKNIKLNKIVFDMKCSSEPQINEKIEEKPKDRLLTDVEAKRIYVIMKAKLSDNKAIIGYLTDKYSVDNTSKLMASQYREIAQEMK